VWFAYGSIVLDRIFDLAVTREVDVFFETTPPSPGEVRKSLGLTKAHQLLIHEDAPSLVCNLDTIEIWPSDNALHTSGSILGEAPRWLELTIHQLEAKDVVRLASWQDMYPSLEVDDLLRLRIESEANYLKSIALKNGEVLLALEDLRTKYVRPYA